MIPTFRLALEFSDTYSRLWRGRRELGVLDGAPSRLGGVMNEKISGT